MQAIIVNLQNINLKRELYHMELWSFHSGCGSHYEQQQLTTTFFSLTLSILLD